jgi:hypothetical protein
MTHYSRLTLFLFVCIFLLMWFCGDFNTYLGTGGEREFKSLATPAERLVGSLVIAGLCSVLFTGAFWATEMTCFVPRRRNGSPPGDFTPRTGRDAAPCETARDGGDAPLLD